MSDERIDPSALPSGTGCVECLAADGWWFHLRRCARCGHIGCCDTSPAQHASRHAAETGHGVIRSFEPGEEWFWDFAANEFCDGLQQLAEPECVIRSASLCPDRKGRVPLGTGHVAPQQLTYYASICIARGVAHPSGQPAYSHKQTAAAESLVMVVESDPSEASDHQATHDVPYCV